MHKVLETLLSALKENPSNRPKQSESQSPNPETRQGIRAALRRHRVSLLGTASYGFTEIPEQVRIRDINEKGLYFFTRLDLAVGATVDILAVLPAEITDGTRARRVHYEAKVVRVERNAYREGIHGVGASIRHCEVCQ